MVTQLFIPNIENVMDMIKKNIFRPLPNSNYVKPNLPSWVFGKAERFTAK